MPLDLAAIIEQINEMAATVDGAAIEERRQTLETVWDELDSGDVNRRYQKAKTSFLLPESAVDYRTRFKLPAIPQTYTVSAADGSFILPDRHGPVRFYVLNTSTVVLSYGQEPSAHIGSEPEVFYKQPDMIVPDDPQRTPIDGAILGFKRAIRELEVAGAGLAGVSGPAVALQDGTLVLWQLQGQSDPVRNWVLSQYLDVLDAFRAQDLPIASYISDPGAAELMNMLRVAVCDYPDQGLAINCDDCRTRAGHTPRCDVLPNVPDRFLLAEVAKLMPGERTTVYLSKSRILDAYDRDGSGEQRICFFYVNTGREIGRVEVPRWVAADLDKLDLVHATIYDQTVLGRGYPVALQEAHEAAVLSMADRRTVEHAIEQALSVSGVVRVNSGKDGSKRGRFV
jgi:hypothetical protein